VLDNIFLSFGIAQADSFHKQGLVIPTPWCYGATNFTLNAWGVQLFICGKRDFRSVVLNLCKHAEHQRSFPSFCRTPFCPT